MDMPDDVREFFRKQGSIGGKRRMKKLSAQERTEIARNAAQRRWADGAKKGSKITRKLDSNRKPNVRYSK
jgi:hypothetical protein